MLVTATELRQIKAGQTEYQQTFQLLLERVNRVMLDAAHKHESKTTLYFSVVETMAEQMRGDLIKRLASVGISAGVKLERKDLGGEARQAMTFDLSW